MYVCLLRVFVCVCVYGRRWFWMCFCRFSIFAVFSACSFELDFCRVKKKKGIIFYTRNAHTFSACKLLIKWTKLLYQSQNCMNHISQYDCTFSFLALLWWLALNGISQGVRTGAADSDPCARFLMNISQVGALTLLSNLTGESRLHWTSADKEESHHHVTFFEEARDFRWNMSAK